MAQRWMKWAGGTAALGMIGAALAWCGEGPARSTSPGAERNSSAASRGRIVPTLEEPNDDGVTPSATAAVRPSPPVQASARSEGALMAELHRLGESDPASSLRLAREGNEQFPGSADAAERAWIVVKALVNMRRFEEARAEAAIVVDAYRGTSWALDVQRHLLVNPLTHPSERGYAQQ